uniref:Uncharacterized protein n=1 Tax=Paramormyrops kingsleyae TaxID=1676925 RepID=A0A3B3QZH5_9TELE
TGKMSDLSDFHCSVIAGAGHGGSSMAEAAAPLGFHIIIRWHLQKMVHCTKKTSGAKNVLLMRGYIGIGRLVKPNRKTISVKITAQCTGGTQKGFSEGISQVSGTPADGPLINLSTHNSIRKKIAFFYTLSTLLLQ